MGAFLRAALAGPTVAHATPRAAATARIAGRYDEAVSRAQSRLALSGALAPTESDRQGDEANGLHWHTVIEAIATAHPTPQAGANAAASMTLYNIVVTLSWREPDGGNRAVQLSSARLGPFE